jgi:hypothetical protein
VLAELDAVTASLSPRYAAMVIFGFILGRVLCRLAYIARDGSTVRLSSAARDRLLLKDRAVRREVLRASKMYGSRGTLVLLDPPRVAVSDETG